MNVPSTTDSATPAAMPWHTYLLQALLLVVLLGVLFPGVFVRGEVISPADILFAVPPWNHDAPADWERPQNPIMSDIVTLFYPMYYEVERSFERGEWPLWNTLELGGMPLLANYESAVFYPPRLLYRVFDVPWAMTLHILLKLWLCGMTAFICGRGLGLTHGVSRFFSVAWMLGTYNVMFAPWCLPDVSAWIPIVFLGLHDMLSGRERRGFLVAVVGGVLLLFSGHPELAFGAALGMGWFFLVYVTLARRGWRYVARVSLLCVSFWGIVLLVTSVQTLPFIEYFLHSSSDTHRVSVAEAAWFKPGSVAAFWVPRFFGLRTDYNYWGDPSNQDYSMLYPGMAVWVGIGALAAAGRSRARNPLVTALLISALIDLGLAFGVPWLGVINRLPVLNTMAPYWHAVFPIFVVPLLAAIGLDQWLREPRNGRRFLAVVAVLTPGIVAVGLIVCFYHDLMNALNVSSYVWRQVAMTGCFFVSALAVLGLSLRNRAALFVPWGMTLVLALDLLVAVRGLNPTLPRAQVYPPTELTAYLQTLPKPTRVGIAEAHIPSGLMAPYGVEEWLGYDGLYPRRVSRLQVALGADVWDAFEPACAIQYYLHDPVYVPSFPLDEPGRFSFVTELDGIQVYRNNRALPLAFLVRSLESVASLDEMFSRMRSPEFDPRREALVLDAELTVLPPEPVERVGKAVVVERRGTLVCVRTETDAPQTLVLADAYYPGWKAYVDGEPAPTFPAYSAFRGVVVPAGEHEVEFRYVPRVFYGGLGVSSAALALMLVYGIASLSSGRRKAR